jgi:hypothetical protein
MTESDASSPGNSGSSGDLLDELLGPRPATRGTDRPTTAPPPPPPPRVTAPAPRPTPTTDASPATSGADYDYFSSRPLQSTWPLSTPSTASAQTRRDTVAIKWAAFAIASAVGFVAGFIGVKAFFFKGDPVINLGDDGEVTELNPERLFKPIAGFGYQAAPVDLSGQIQGMMESDPQTAEVVNRVSTRVITQGSQPAGFALAVSLDPNEIEDKSARQDVLDGFESGISTVTGIQGNDSPGFDRTEFGGKVAYETDVNGVSVVVVFYENVFITFAGQGSIGETVASSALERLP